MDSIEQEFAILSERPEPSVTWGQSIDRAELERR